MEIPLVKNMPIRFSCYASSSRDGEQFVPEHAIGYVVSGSNIMTDVNGSVEFAPGDIYFARRNRLAKYIKIPPEGGDFRAISIFFPRDLLRDFSLKYGYASAKKADTPAFIHLENKALLMHYMESLREYETILSQPGSEQLFLLKQEEAIMLLLKTNPWLADILFDVSEPGKIDLEAFMNQNFHFNVSLDRFAYLTGRSISTFKRDFEKTFSITPSRWLLKKRLEEAYYLLKEKHRTASEIYLDLGFEDLSHFSFAFKKQYGVAPSMLV